MGEARASLVSFYSNMPNVVAIVSLCLRGIGRQPCTQLPTQDLLTPAGIAYVLQYQALLAHLVCQIFAIARGTTTRVHTYDIATPAKRSNPNFQSTHMWATSIL